MNKRGFLLNMKALSRYKHAAVRVGKGMLPKRKKLLFVFEGRTYYWRGVGKDLYKKEDVFRQSICKCDALTREIAGISILSNFEDFVNEDTVEEAVIIFTITSFHIALYDLWKSKGILPNAIFGMSLGEVSGAYAAGGLSLRDTIKITTSFARISQLEKNEFAFFYLNTNISAALQTCKNSPAFLAVIYEIGEKSVLVTYHKDNKELITRYLDANEIGWKMLHDGTSWPYHSPLVAKHKIEIESFTKDIEPLPLQCNFYSCTLGKMLPKNTIIEPGFWYDLAHQPVLTHSALQYVKHEGFDLAVHISPHPFLKGQIIRGNNSETRIISLDSVNKNEKEIVTFNKSYDQLKKTRLERSTLFNTGITTQLDDFRKHFNLTHPQIVKNPYPYFKYLQKHGNIHFLPVYNSWLILDYEDIDYVFKNPQFFSSTIHKTFDEFLIGADPPSHTLMRSLLQPLFSPQVFAKIGEFTTVKSHQLLDKLKSRSQFNIVDEFSLPLAEAVVAKLLGFSSAEEEAVKNCFEGHVYGLGFLHKLEEFCKNYLEENKDSNKDNIATLLLSFVRDGSLPFNGAVSVMKLLWIAGMTTTSMLLSTAIYMLAKDEALLQQLRENEQLINKFIEECLRLDAPESELKRITTQEVEICGTTLPLASIVMLGLRAANRDPKYFEEPEKISFNRSAKRHLSFGGGYHYCLGVGMARVEVRQALKAVLERMPAIHLIAGEPVSYFPSPHFRGLTNLVITQTIQN